MCFPPFCQPASHVFGCLSLRQGAGGVLVINGAYGLAMVVVHALLLGENGHTVSERGSSTREAREASAAGLGERRLRGLSEESNKPGEWSWLLQTLDLDISWGHRLLGFEDKTCLVSGLIYGIVVIVACIYMFHAVHSRGQSLPTQARWFVAFMNLEIILYLGIVLVKLPKLCAIQQSFLPDLYMECTVLRFVFLERLVVSVLTSCVCTWIFASFAFVLTFGHTALNTTDRPEFAHELDIMETQQNLAASRGPPPAASFAGRVGGSFMARPDTRHSVGLAPPTSQGLLGSSMSHHYTQSLRAPGAAGTRMGPPRTSYSIGHMPRASSSMVTTSEHSETAHLIKPPLAIY